MKSITLYHGSNRIVKEPKYHFLSANRNNDYGEGFYCCLNKEAGKEWACKGNAQGYVNQYELDTDNLKILDLTDKKKYSVLNWVAILMNFRKLSADLKETRKEELNYLHKHYYLDVSQYDMVIGFRADDSYFAFPKAFITNQLTLNRLEEIYTLGNLGIQHCIISDKAFRRLKFIKCEQAEFNYIKQYRTKIENASSQFNEILKTADQEIGTRIRDLINNDKINQ